MSLERWSGFVAILLAVLCTPGPDFAVVVRYALVSARHGAHAAAGVLTGLVGHTTAAALGLSALVVSRPEVLDAVRFAGAAYLAWLGLHALRAASRAAPVSAEARSDRGARSGRPYRDGLAGNLLNPKAILFFLGLIPQFVAPTSDTTAQIVLLAATTLGAAAVWWAVVIGVVGRGRSLLQGGRARRATDVVTGAALVGVAVGVGLS